MTWNVGKRITRLAHSGAVKRRFLNFAFLHQLNNSLLRKRYLRFLPVQHCLINRQHVADPRPRGARDEGARRARHWLRRAPAG